jgi:hypothetical protein
MKSTITYFILFIGILNAGCSSRTDSNILKSYSLQGIASKTAYKNIDCSKATSGDDYEGSASGIGGTGSMRPSIIRCEVIEAGNNRFSEADLFDALLSEVEKEIKVNNGTITSKGRPGVSNFIVDYEVNGRQGKINISGKRLGSSYELTSEIREITK